MIKTVTTSCLAALTLGLHAGEATTPAPKPTCSTGCSAGDIFLGANAREDAWYTYGGANFSLNGDKSTNGFILHGLLGYGEYEYDTLLGGVEGEISELDLGIGYQWFISGHRVSLIGALNLVDHDLTGNLIDLANNSVNGSETGFKPKLDIWNTDASSFLYGGTFTYSTAYDSYWNRVVFTKNLGPVFLGPELIVQGNEEYEETRAGLALLGLKLGMFDVGASVGYSWADPKQGITDQEGIYSSIHMSFSF
jgi:hypothetical protein